MEFLAITRINELLMNAVDMKGKKILIVEDDFFVSDIYQTKFSHEGCMVSVANDGEDALKLLREGLLPDIILLDIIMPNMDGREFLEAMKNLPNADSFPVLVLSNLSQKEDIDGTKALGAKDYIVKSHLTPTEVFNRVVEFLAKGKV